jgi:hypothetical protein
MINYIGFAFTEEPILRLKQKGFTLFEKENTKKNGYKSFSAIFSNQSSFEVREIIEEQDYLKFHSVESFKPLVATEQISEPFRGHANSVTKFRQLVDSTSVPEDREIHLYFKLRKATPLWALWLECDNFTAFNELAKPDHLFDFDGKKAALIHLGPNCFDLLITQVSR